MTPATPRPTEVIDHVPSALSDLRFAAEALREEIDAMVGYRERASRCADPELREVLHHNAREEAEHAAMLIEWLRRNESSFAEEIDTYLYRDGSLMQAERRATGNESSASDARGIELRIEPLAATVQATAMQSAVSTGGRHA